MSPNTNGSRRSFFLVGVEVRTCYSWRRPAACCNWLVEYSFVLFRPRSLCLGKNRKPCKEKIWLVIHCQRSLRVKMWKWVNINNLMGSIFINDGVNIITISQSRFQFDQSITWTVTQSKVKYRSPHIVRIKVESEGWVGGYHHASNLRGTISAAGFIVLSSHVSNVKGLSP